MSGMPDSSRPLHRELARAEALPGASAALARGIAHCAQGIELSLSGYPRLKPAWFRATVGRLALKVFLRRGEMRHDLEAAIPGAEDIPAGLSFADAVARLRRAVTAFDAHPGPLAPHFAYGALGRGQYERVHAMHLADHLRDV